ncbi:MAG TPA: FAD-dependent oxidoreductase [Longimicrobiales bacterium]
MRQYVLVGSGIAALSAAEAIRDADPRARITLASSEPHAFYSRPGLAYFLTGEIPERRLEIRRRAEILDLRIERLHGTAVRVDTTGHRLVLKDGRSLGYDRLLLAPGAASVPADFEGAGLEGVVRLDGLDDARRIRHLARDGRRAVVIGGGITALELVEAFIAGGARTHYLMRSDRYWPRVLDSPEARLVEARLEAEDVRLHHRTKVARAFGRKGRIRGVETTAGDRIECDVLAVAVGVRPRTDLARVSGLEVERGIVADEYLRTSAPDVFAAGDAAEVHDSTDGSALLDTLWASAAAQGRAVGATMAGSPTAYLREPALNVTRLAGIVTTIVGAVEGGGEDDPDLVTISRGQSERWRTTAGGWAIRGDRGEDRVRLILGADRIAGAMVMGDQTLSRPLTRMVRERVDATPLCRALREHPDALIPLVEAFARTLEIPHARAG